MDDGGGALTATGLICGSCGTHCSSTGKFCNECGEPVAQATRSAEYKQVTVLFADVVRSMDLAAVLDMERLREVMTELFGALGGGRAALWRDRGVHRRRRDGDLRRPSCVGG